MSSFLLFFLCLQHVFALPSDSEQKMYISSDTAEINKLTGIGIFTGNVSITRGTTHITAEKLTTFNDANDQIKKAIALGTKKQRAEYKTLTKKNKPVLIAKAVTLTYFPLKHYVILDGDATVSQGKDYISGPHLEYDLQKQVLITKKSQNENEKNIRTTIVIQPANLSKNNLKD
tara:strand:+ start:623 stop:1144 length:522 start_codon:yes stop_codon:yes gene_type:complete